MYFFFRLTCVCLQGLRAGIPWGQAQFQQLLRSWHSEAGTEDMDLEELRYRWMLYKSKLKEAENTKAQLKLQVVGERFFFPLLTHSSLKYMHELSAFYEHFYTVNHLRLN